MNIQRTGSESESESESKSERKRGVECTKHEVLLWMDEGFLLVVRFR